MQASPFSTLAAILVTFKQTLRDIQQHPKRYAVLLATNSSSNSGSGSGSGEGRSSKKAVPGHGGNGVPASAAAENKRDGESSPSVGKASAATAAESEAATEQCSGVQGQLLRKRSGPVSCASAAASAAACGGIGKAERSQRVSRLSPDEQRLQLPKRSSSCFALASSLQRRLPQQQKQQNQRVVAAEQQGSSVVQQPHQHSVAVAVRLPSGAPLKVSRAAAADKAIDCFRGTSAGAEAAAAAAAAGSRASLRALIDEPSFPALDIAASINKALFAQDIRGDDTQRKTAAPAATAGAATRAAGSVPTAPVAEAHQGSIAEQTSMHSAGAVAEQPGNRPQLRQQLQLQQSAPTSASGPFFPPRVVPRHLKQQQQQQQGVPPRSKVPLVLRPRLPPPKYERSEQPSGPRLKGGHRLVESGAQQQEQQLQQQEQQPQEEQLEQ